MYIYCIFLGEERREERPLDHVARLLGLRLVPGLGTNIIINDNNNN